MLIIGCGYTGRRLAARLLEKNQSVVGIVSTESSARLLQQQDIPLVMADLDDPDLDLPLAEHRQIFYLAPPPGEGQTDPRLTRVLDGLRRKELSPRIVYVSTTGVYGDCQGEWVKEDRPPNPTTDRAQRRRDAEMQLQQFARDTGAEVIILRVAGIYGPGRLPLERALSGAPVLRLEDSPFSNRIHVDDLATVCLQAMACGAPGQVYNVSDGVPGTMTQYFSLLAELIGADPLPTMSWDEAEAVMPPGLMSYLRENRRIDNGKMMQELGVELRYPELKQGIQASLNENPG